MITILVACALSATALAAPSHPSLQGGATAAPSPARTLAAQDAQTDDGADRRSTTPRVYLPDSRDGDSIAPPSRRAGHASFSIGRQAVGLNVTDGQLIGGGPDYEVRFDRGGITYLPALGAKAAKLYPLRFEVTGVGRRSGPSTPATRAEPSAEGCVVRYSRAGFEERYEVGPVGVEQSFSFATLPPGAGDLVVRGRIATELPLARAAADELRLEVDGLGGVRIGAVTGVDANGARTAGALRFADGEIELSLPAEFVDHAALPLVVDPLVGTAFNVNTLPMDYDDENPDVAYDQNNGVYLVVWQRRFSSTGVAIRGQLVTAAGGFSGNLISIRPSTSLATSPRVANIHLRHTFVVVWQ